MGRLRIASGAPWESIVGYSRALRVENNIYVSGTTAINEKGQVLAVGDAYEQTRIALRRIEQALAEAGGQMTDIVRTRMFVTDMNCWEEIGRAHGEFFAAIRPATSMLEVSRLIDPAMLVEIEADAIVDAT